MLRALSDSALQELIQEDAPYGDMTTMGLGLGDAPGRVVMAARQPMTVCGTEEAARLFELYGASATVIAPSGTHVLAGAELLSAHGRASTLLLVWKVAQTLMEYASSISSEVARIVTELRAAGHAQPLACTRKSFPGTRALSVKAVLQGGGVMHRMGLSETMLLFPEHRVFLDVSTDDMVGRLRKYQPEKRLVVEVGSLEEALAMATSGADVLQLERFTPEAVRQCKMTLHTSRLHPTLAVAGGVNAANAVAYADAGADILVSSAPYHAPARDVEVRFSRDV
ncbi:pyrophosphorylase [Aquabacterium sp. NJ1]|uniref:ModD protein n=1 Tax=Aquabacterium sp. NJ1 TaxID=1538295 RepID=UPI00052C5336|nr:ModD protein [Aquabacterium sp. NJ1]KGM39590.1 pyrophosphorylase [Aquabacterium sp. NJ1]